MSTTRRTFVTALAALPAAATWIATLFGVRQEQRQLEVGFHYLLEPGKPYVLPESPRPFDALVVTVPDGLSRQFARLETRGAAIFGLSEELVLDSAGTWTAQFFGKDLGWQVY